MARLSAHRILRASLWTLIGIVLLILSIPVLLYVPAVQNLVKDIALKEVKKSTGMEIEIGYLRLKFPLNVQLHDVTVVEATGDTMAIVGTAGVDVKLLPLLKGIIDVKGTQLSEVKYNLGNRDSAMYLTAYVRNFDAEGANMNLSKGMIDVGKAMLDGADVRLVIKDTVTQEKTDTAAAKPLLIHAGEITLKNVTYTMQMLPTIDSLRAEIPVAMLIDGTVDMSVNKIHAQMLSVDSISATYLTPSAEFMAHYNPHDTISPDTIPATAPWTITADSLRLTAKNALYAMRGAMPLPGLDMNYIQVKDVSIAVDSFYNKATAIRVPLRKFSATERCGVGLNAHGTFMMDSAAMHAKEFEISTLFSKINLDAMMGMGNITTDPNLPIWVKAQGNIGFADIEQIMPTTKTILRDVPRSNGLQLLADVEGTASRLHVNNVEASLPRYIMLKANGYVDYPMMPQKIGGDVKLAGSLTNANFISSIALDRATAKQVTIPNMKLKGNIHYSPAGATGNIAAFTGQGKMAFDGKWQKRSEGYNAKLVADAFPVQAFMPSLGVGDITATITVDGHGYDPRVPSTVIHADASIDGVDYNGKHLSNTRLEATLANGEVKGYLDSHNPEADFSADFSGTVTKNLYTWTVNGDVRHINLQALGLSETPLYGSMLIDTEGSFAPANMGIDADVAINHVNWVIDENKLIADEVLLNLLTGDSTSHATLKSGDLNATFTAYTGLDSTISKLSSITAVMDSAIARHNLDVRALQRAIPPMDANINLGQNNLAATFLATSGIQWDNASMTVHNDSLLSLHAKTLGLATKTMRTDTIALDALQHGKYLVYTINMNNRPGTFDDFAHVTLRGYLANDKASFIVHQRNIQNKEGFFIGVNAAMTDSMARVSFIPHKPVIGYKQWTLNSDNFVSYNFFTHHIDADLMLDNTNSSLHLYTEQSTDTATVSAQNDVVLQLKNIMIQDWLSISPFAPPMKGNVGADMRFNWNTTALTGHGTVNLNDFYYGRERVGDFDIDLSVFNDKTGLLQADASLMVDSVKVITARGVLNDSTATSPFLLDFSMIHFPLRIVNPFLPKGTAALSGMLNGEMDITGSLTNPIFNGFLDFDSTAVKLAMTGASYRFSEDRIPVDSSIVHFKNFTISGLNGNPLYVNGIVDAHELSNPQINLNLNAKDMQLVNSNRPRGADIYGKAFIDLDADVTGNMRLLRVNANLNLLPGTNVTYVVSSVGQSALTSQSTGSMVTFVQFSDTANVVSPDTVVQNTMAMFLDANLTLSAGCTINADLSTDGQNKASLQPEGNLTYTLTPMSSDGRLTGRINIDKGFVRYTPPFMSEKNFTFQEGSYVAFSGDILNPTLNIHAADHIKANVTQEGQNSRLVNFIVSLSATNTLNNMDVAFDLSTNDDLTIQNELQGMSPEQRANQAMNMLLYNVYTGPRTKANASLSGNPLYSFLTSRLNSWAANNIKGVDISFGIDQYDKTTDGTKSTATSYSYKVSKTLFNDRFKIVVGGNYSTDADQDENLAENLVNDVAVEYMLNRSGSMYVRVFRHVGYESILEGEITQTGVGFVLKRKINRLSDIFRRQRTLTPQPSHNNPQPAQQ